jgi:hypothetical protein
MADWVIQREASCSVVYYGVSGANNGGSNVLDCCRHAPGTVDATAFEWLLCTTICTHAQRPIGIVKPTSIFQLTLFREPNFLRVDHTFSSGPRPMTSKIPCLVLGSLTNESREEVTQCMWF